MQGKKIENDYEEKVMQRLKPHWFCDVHLKQ